MKKQLIAGFVLFLTFTACKKENEANETTTDSMTTDKTSTTENTGSTGGNTSTVVEIPTTYIVAGADTFFLVSKQQLFDNYKFRYQINFGTRAQLQQNVEETGQNSTIGFVLSFSEKPTNSATYQYTSSRFTIDSTQVNIYNGFFLNTGYSIENKNYLSPDSGSVDLTINSGKVNASLGPIVLSDEADNTKKLDMSGVFDFVW